MNLVCSGGKCRVEQTRIMSSNGYNLFMCFQCEFMLCIDCADLKLPENTDLLAPDALQRHTEVAIGDEVLKLPPSYDEWIGMSQEPENAVEL